MVGQLSLCRKVGPLLLWCGFELLHFAGIIRQVRKRYCGDGMKKAGTKAGTVYIQDSCNHQLALLVRLQR